MARSLVALWVLSVVAFAWGVLLLNDASRDPLSGGSSIGSAFVAAGVVVAGLALLAQVIRGALADGLHQREQQRAGRHDG